MRSCKILGFISALLFVSAGPALATPDPSPDADAVGVRLEVDCGVAPDNENCFEDMGALTTWIWGTRGPGPGDRLTVEIGAGSFGSFVCGGAGGGSGHVTLRGAGVAATTLLSSDAAFPPVEVDGCTDLDFLDLKVHSTAAIAQAGAVEWAGNGNSRWIGTEIVADDVIYSWWDTSPVQGTCPATLGRHYFFKSSLRGSSGGNYSAALYATCQDIFVFGGELSLDEGGAVSGGLLSAAAILVNEGKLDAVDTTIRADVDKSLAVGIFAFGTNDSSVRLSGGTIEASGISEGIGMYILGPTTAPIDINGTGMELSPPGARIRLTSYSADMTVGPQ